MRTLILLIAATLVVSGCAGSSDTKASETPTTSAPPPTVSDEFGSIDGLVMDEELAPLAGVTVAIRDTERTTKSDDGGRFVFNEILPGAYTVFVDKIGYDAVARKVDVVAGVVSSLNFTMKPIAVGTEAIITTFNFDGFLQCSYNPQYSVNPCEPVLGANKDRHVFEVQKDVKVAEFVMELVWTPASAQTGQELELDLCYYHEDPVDDKLLCRGTLDTYYEYRSGPSPNIIRSAKTIPYKTYQKYMVGAGSAWDETKFAYQQAFKIYGSVCYLEKCPDEYTLLPPA